MAVVMRGEMFAHLSKMVGIKFLKARLRVGMLNDIVPRLSKDFCSRPYHTYWLCFTTNQTLISLKVLSSVELYMGLPVNK